MIKWDGLVRVHVPPRVCTGCVQPLELDDELNIGCQARRKSKKISQINAIVAPVLCNKRSSCSGSNQLRIFTTLFDVSVRGVWVNFAPGLL